MYHNISSIYFGFAVQTEQIDNLCIVIQLSKLVAVLVNLPYLNTTLYYIYNILAEKRNCACIKNKFSIILKSIYA